MRFNIILTIFVVGLLTTITDTAWAQRGGKVGASAAAMLIFGNGKMGNSTDVLERSMMYTPIAILVGYNIKKFRIGLNYEYNMAGQTDDPSGLSNQNLSGKGSSTGLRLGFYNGRTSFDAIYHINQSYTMDKPTITGSTAEYEGKSGYGVQFYMQVKKKLGVVVDYQMGELKSVGGFTDDLKWNRVGLGIVFSNFAGGRR